MKEGARYVYPRVGGWVTQRVLYFGHGSKDASVEFCLHA